MNARQKAKKYKRELDILKGQVVPFKIASTQGKVETIRVERRFSMGVLSYMPSKIVVNEMIKELSSSDTFKHAMRLDNHYEEFNGAMIVQAELKVVMPDDNSSDW